MSDLFEEVASEIFQISSEQRLTIIKILSEKKARLSDFKNDLNSSKSEIHRNLTRLLKSKIISKDKNGYYFLTTYGNVIESQLTMWILFYKNKNFFSKHHLGNLPYKFIQRIGALSDSSCIQGFVKVQKCWKDIYSNAEKYISSILYEIPYDDEILKLIKNKTKNGVKLKNIFSIPVIISENRKDLLKKTGLEKSLKDGKIERRIKKNTQVLVVLNEKEACVHFPDIEGKIDVGQALYGNNSLFHEWCLDYFRESCENSSPFREESII